MRVGCQYCTKSCIKALSTLDSAAILGLHRPLDPFPKGFCVKRLHDRGKRKPRHQVEARAVLEFFGWFMDWLFEHPGENLPFFELLNVLLLLQLHKELLNLLVVWLLPQSGV